MKISIIGAGPVGSYCGYLLAKSGHQVSIYEEHSQIGLPIQCTGLLTADLDQFNLPTESFLINTFSQIEINSPNHKVIIPQKEYLVCRHKFDNFLADLARNAGARIYTNHAFVRKEKNGLVIKNSNLGQEININPEIVIAADGPQSKTAKAFDLYHPDREHYIGVQALVEGNFEVEKYQTYFGNSVCPDLFAWIVPESSTKARVGLASKKDARKLFDQFMIQQNFTATEIQAGTIPLYHPKQKLHRDNCYLLGDASGFVKATTLGGIIPGMKQAEILAKSINDGKDYEKETKSLKKRLKMHLRLRNIFNKFSDSDWDKLVRLLGQEKIQQVLQEHTRENPLPMVWKAVVREPRLLWFSRFLF